MRHQHQGHVFGVFQQQVLLALAARAANHGLRHARGRPLELAQHALDHLLQVGLALAQIEVFHFVKLARHHIELTGQSPFGVVEALADPMGHALGQQLILQQHQMHIEQGGQLGGRIFGQGQLQSLYLLEHHLFGALQAINFAINLVWFDEVMGHINTAGGDQHGAANGNAPRDGQSMDGKGHLRPLRSWVRRKTSLVITRLRQTCRPSAPTKPAWLLALDRRRFPGSLGCPPQRPTSSPP